MSILEDSKRIDDYAVFTLPRVLEGLWYLIKKILKLKDINDFQIYLFAICIGIVYYLKKHETKNVPYHYIRQFDFSFLDRLILIF